MRIAESVNVAATAESGKAPAEDTSACARSLVTITTVASAAVLMRALTDSQMPWVPNIRLMPGNGFQLFQGRLHRLGGEGDAALGRRGDGTDDHHPQRHRQQGGHEGGQRLPHQHRQRGRLGIAGHPADLHEQFLHGVERVAHQHRQQHAGRRDTQPGAQLLGAWDLPFLARLLQALGSRLLGLLAAGTVLDHQPLRRESMARAAWSSSASSAGGSSGKVRPSIVRVSRILSGKPNAKMLSAGAARLSSARATSASSRTATMGPAICSAARNIIEKAVISTAAIWSVGTSPPTGRPTYEVAKPLTMSR